MSGSCLVCGHDLCQCDAVKAAFMAGCKWEAEMGDAAKERDALKAKLAEADATIDNLAHQATHVTCRMERDRLTQRWAMLTSWIRSNPEPTLSRLDAHHLIHKLEADND